MKRTTTVRDVAEHAGVSIATVSRVMNNHANIQADLRQRVLDAAIHLGYGRMSNRPPSLITAKSALKEVVFLLTYGDIHDEITIDPFWAHILHGTEVEARAANIRVTYLGISHLTQTPELLLSKLQAMRVGGILLVGDADQGTIQTVQAAQIPFVLVDNAAPALRPPVDAVLSDNVLGTRMAVDYLLQQGHRTIAFIGGHQTASMQTRHKIYTIERREEGFHAALREAGLTVAPDLVVSCDISQPEGGEAACQHLLERHIPFSAVVCANDYTAIGVMRALRAAGKRVPEDVSVIGFDDIDTAQHLTPALTTVRVHKEAMGSMALKTLIARCNDPQALPYTVLVHVDLIARASVAPLGEER